MHQIVFYGEQDELGLLSEECAYNVCRERKLKNLVDSYLRLIYKVSFKLVRQVPYAMSKECSTDLWKLEEAVELPEQFILLSL